MTVAFGERARSADRVVARQQELVVTVVSRRREADNITSFTLAHRSATALPRWTPGSHVDVYLGEGLVRQYSLNGHLDAPEWRISVLREPNSRGGSAYLHERVAVGDHLRVSAPRNNFSLQDAERYIFVAGGIGISPLLPMLEQLARRNRDWELHYAGRSSRQMAFLDHLQRFGERVRIYPDDVCGRPPVSDIAELAGRQRGTAVYCCGPRGMMDALQLALQERPGTTLHLERFAPVVDAGKGSSPIKVRLRSSGTTIEVPADKSILECLEDGGVDILSSCRSGTCGTCMTGVLAGEPDHRDSVLSDAERESGEWILPCVSRAHSAELELDL